MNVLVVGGCGFIGSNLVKRLSIRKHMVSVIDIRCSCAIKLSEEGVEYHPVDAASKACKEIFETGHFDTVVYAAGTALGKKDIENGPEFSALVNILDLCVEFQVKNLVYLSTAYLNSYRPISENPNVKGYPGIDIYCANKMMGEYYCSMYKKLYNLKTSILRLPPVYGPGQDADGEGGIVLGVFKSCRKKESSIIQAYGNTVELSYIQDVSDRLYDLICSEESGIFGYKGTYIDVDVLASKIKVLMGAESIEISFQNGAEINLSSTDEIKLLNALEENSSIDFGLDKTRIWFLSNENSEVKPAEKEFSVESYNKKFAMVLESHFFKNSKKRVKRVYAKAADRISRACGTAFLFMKKVWTLFESKMQNVLIQWSNYKKRHFQLPLKKFWSMLTSIKRVFPWMENILLCLAAAWLGNSMNVPFDPNLISIMIMGLIFGVVQSVAAACLCTVLSLDVININKLETAMVYFLIALISGFSATGKTLEMKRLKESYTRLEQLYLALKKDFSNKKKAASMMAEQIRTTEKNFGKILDIIRRINNRPANEVLLEIPHITFELTGFHGIELYLAADQWKRFVFYCSEESKPDTSELKKYFDFGNKDCRDEVLNKGRVYINTLQDCNVPGAIIPVHNYINGKIEGIITIKHIPFLKLNINTEYMLYFTGEFLSNFYSNAAGNLRDAR